MGPKRRGGTGSVYKSGDRWVAQVRRYEEHLGKSVKHRRYAQTRDAARALLRELREDTPEPRPSKATTVRAYLARWEESTLPLRDLAPSSKDAYRHDIAYILGPSLGETRLAAFDPAEAERWLARLHGLTTRSGRPLAASTQRRAFSVLSGALDTAVRDRLIAENPLKKVQRPRAERVRVPFHRAEMVSAALAACKGRRVHCLALTAAYTGARISELLALDWADIDVSLGQLQIRDGKSRSARRAIPLVPKVADGLMAWRREQLRERVQLGDGWRAGDAVFTTGKGARLTVAQSRRDLQVALRVAGLESTRPWHTMRHSVATRLLADGVPMPMVSAILGHASIAITVDVYGHLEPILAADQMERALA